MDEQILSRWVEKAARAPSAHNTQPACWHLEADGGILLLENPERHLKVADPGKNDQYLALGAAFEGLNLAASEDGIKLSAPEFNPAIGTTGIRNRTLLPFARTRVAGNCIQDRLAHLVPARATYRGPFNLTPPAVHAAFRNWAISREDLIPIAEPMQILELSELYDQCAYEFAKSPAYYAELHSWLRFNESHKNWPRDGLNATALGMTIWERIFGPYVAHPAAFDIWKTLGLGGLLVSEKKVIRSAAFLLVFVLEKDVSPFDAGRLFYRLWLEISALNLVLCPMSSISDNKYGERYLRDKFGIVSSKKIVNIFRIGTPPRGLPKPSPRLPVQELVV